MYSGVLAPIRVTLRVAKMTSTMAGITGLRRESLPTGLPCETYVSGWYELLKYNRALQ